MNWGPVFAWVILIILALTAFDGATRRFQDLIISWTTRIANTPKTTVAYDLFHLVEKLPILQQQKALSIYAGREVEWPVRIQQVLGSGPYTLMLADPKDDAIAILANGFEGETAIVEGLKHGQVIRVRGKITAMPYLKYVVINAANIIGKD